MRIYSIMWRPGRSQLADPLTKQGACRDKLRQAHADLESQRSSSNKWVEPLYEQVPRGLLSTF